ncbi:hypothetical protein LOTGIDRAFT_160192 [Lottia gigantea]|uniref:G-protein coupled receptors family 1 profile domain-containing protein n=1 Tax=Lottia gigantea TaxID=225164 RepID=V3ZVV3_LOTGI|nr:hypothetical protein LOTGIDRAFT_160192 [Lottia gigantea]ESO95643.1 hypothetical protein LOTGIDRAFT_160192 [Lottia gigantea]
MVQFAITYGNIHGYFSIVVCIFGIISNILNIVVLTRKHMSSPTNYILTALAIADMLTMSTYPIMACYLYIISRPDCDGTNHSKEWMYFILFHNLFIVTCHNMAMWLTVSLAVFRYIFVCQHAMAMVMCSLARARVTVMAIVGATILICLPNYLMYTVIDYGKSNNMTSCFWVVSSEIAVRYPAYEMFVRWLFGVVIKILPCILLTVLSTLIIIAMHEAKKRRSRLLGMVNRASDHDNASSEHNRTTMMLVLVVLTFVITELPQGILALISAVNTDFFSRVYVNLGDLMDLLVLINSAVNFILYCIMSQQFRNTFKSLFVGKYFRPFFNKNPSQNGTSYTMVKTETTQV